jgi:3-deoxy-7-phosphoheptulonate synthase
VVVVTRMGAGKVRAHLPAMVRAVQASGLNVLWVCDPVHGNTVTASGGKKTR